MTILRYPRPQILEAMTPLGHRTIEASAGTGKTWTLERIVLDLLLQHEVRLEEILVVTFTEKATRELQTRIRRLLLDVLEGSKKTGPDDTTWDIGPKECEKLRNTLRSFDQAAIHTIHGFCQRVLQTYAFQSSGSLAPTLVDSRTAFGSAFRTVLRGTLARDPGLSTLLNMWLKKGKSVEQLEDCLFAAHKSRGTLFYRDLDPGEVTKTAQALHKAADSIDVDSFVKHLKDAGFNKRKRPGGKIKLVLQTAERLADGEDVLQVLADWDYLKQWDPSLFITELGEIVPADRAAADLRDALVNFSRSWFTREAFTADRLLPLVRAELVRSKCARGQLDYDDLLDQALEALDDDGAGSILENLRSRFRFALVDEFQDTDPVQWEIFRRIFVDPPESGTLLVIGDPKQAIYGFRGADIRTYLAARDQLAKKGSNAIVLDTNYRSSPGLVEALNTVFDREADPPFFSGEIQLESPLKAGREATLVHDQQNILPLHIVHATPGFPSEKTGDLNERHRRWMAQEIARIAGDPKTALRFQNQEEERPLTFRDVFVLVRTHAEAHMVAAEFRRCGVPFGLHGRDNLFQSDEAHDVLHVLEAVHLPHDHRLRLRAWATPFFEVPLGKLPQYGELEESHPLLRRLVHWNHLAEKGRLHELLGMILQQSGLMRRLIFFERTRALANYRQILETLLEVAASLGGDLGALTGELRAYIAGHRLPEGQDTNTENDEGHPNAVQIMTMHKSKGLQRPVVFLHGGWTSVDNNTARVVHTPERTTYVGRFLDRDSDLKTQRRREETEEYQRLLYVASTRAEARLYVSTIDRDEAGKCDFGVQSGPATLLSDRLRNILDGPERESFLGNAHVVSLPAMEDLQPAPLEDSDPWEPSPTKIAPIWTRSEYDRIRREHAGLLMESYSSMKRYQGGYQHPLDADTFRSHSEDDVHAPAHTIPGGAQTGLFFHHVIENLSFESILEEPDLDKWTLNPGIEQVFQNAMRRYDMDPIHLDQAMHIVHSTLTRTMPLGGSGPTVRFAEMHDSRKEIGFTYPIPEEILPRLGEPWMQPTCIHRGYMRGFIDFLFRHDEKMWVLDWKSDVLGNYSPEALDNHVNANYSLQASIYTLAVLKMLDVRDEKDYLRKFGGVLYCFMRGMDQDPAALWFERQPWEAIQSFERGLITDRFGRDTP